MIKLAQEIRSILNNNAVFLERTGCTVVAGISKSIAYHLPVPSTAVENPRKYFLEQHGVAVLDVVGDINEGIVIDTDKVKDLVYRIWKIRYDVVHVAMSVHFNDLVKMVKVNGVPDKAYKDLSDNEKKAIDHISAIVTHIFEKE